MSKKRYAAPSPVLIPARWSGGAQTPGLIVIHATVGPTKAGSARGVAKFFQTEATPTSAHYVVDEAETFQCVPDHTVAYHCGYNDDSIGIEMCFMPVLSALTNWLTPGRKVKQHVRIPLAQLRPEVGRMIKRAAALGGDLALAYDIPVTFLGVKELHAWDAAGRPAHLGGFTTHALMSAAFKKSTHWDPGAWPRGLFMRLVVAHVAKVQGSK